MAGISRRGFIGACGAAAAVRIPENVRASLAVSPRSRTAAGLRHVVVLMQENRSFDHYFGTLRGVRGLDDRAALRRRDGTDVFAQCDASGATIRPYRHDASKPPADLDHSWHGTHAACNDGRHDAWVTTKGAASMAYLDRAAIPYHFSLADQFTVCDHYFCSVMGPTKPNRLYLWSGTCDPHGAAGGPAIDNSLSGFRWTTYPERLQAAGVDWKIYQNANDNYDDNALAWFAAFADAKPGTPLFDRGMASVPATTGETCADIVRALENDVLGGTLPFASWIVAPESCSEHPTHSPQNGAGFIARVAAALMADPAVWASTALIINYDENDGFFDHVVPPTAPAGTADEFVAGAPIGLGPRVPMIVASPWSKGGYVCSQVFDHTSVIRLMENLTGVAEPTISSWRRQVCGDLMSAFDFIATSVAVPASLGRASSTLQEPGVRPARAVPYRAEVNARVSRDELTLQLSNEGAASVHLAVHARDGNVLQRFDIASNDGVVTHAVDIDGDYDIAVHGANGFLRQFYGTRSASIDVTFGSDESLRYRIAFVNRGTAATVAKITDTLHGNHVRHIDVAAGSSVVVNRDAAATNGWYDLAVSLCDTSDFLWRFAGHIETGRESISG
jgi:phospholipase C